MKNISFKTIKGRFFLIFSDRELHNTHRLRSWISSRWQTLRSTPLSWTAGTCPARNLKSLSLSICHTCQLLQADINIQHRIMTSFFVALWRMSFEDFQCQLIQMLNLQIKLWSQVYWQRSARQTGSIIALCWTHLDHNKFTTFQPGLTLLEGLQTITNHRNN